MRVRDDVLAGRFMSSGDSRHARREDWSFCRNRDRERGSGPCNEVLYSIKIVVRMKPRRHPGVGSCKVNDPT